MQHRGEAVAKASILADVWGEEFDGDPNVIEVYVGYIRRKLDEVGCHDFIRTVRGVGYLVPDSR
jgi:DNA-binding response OmpR family regulator